MLFEISLVILILSMFIAIPENIQFLLQLFVILNLFFLILIKRYNIKELLVYLSIFIIVLINHQLRVLLALLLLKNINLKKMNRYIKIYFAANLLVILLTITFNKLGYISTDTFIRIIDGVRVERLSYGFEHPNIFSIYVFFTLLAYVYIRRNRLTKFEQVLIILLTIFIYSKTNTRALPISVFFTLIMVNVFSMNFIKRYKFIFGNIPLIYTIFSIISTKLLSNIPFLVELSSNRFILWEYYLDNTSLFGKSTVEFALDNGYIDLIYRNGIVFTVIVVILFKKLLYILIDTEKRIEIILVNSMLFYNFFESILFKSYLNFTILFFAYLISSQYVKRSKISQS